MNVLFYGNCQMAAVVQFLKLHPEFDSRFQAFTGEGYKIHFGVETFEDVAARWKCADLVLHQTVRPGRADSTERFIPFLRPGVELVAMPVFYNCGSFFGDWNWSGRLKAEVAAEVAERGVAGAVDHYWNEGDLHWVERYEFCLAKMKRKEADDGVDPALRMSGFVEDMFCETRIFLTQNHPSTLPLSVFASRIGRLLGLPPDDALDLSHLNRPPNWAGLPCVDYVSPSASDALDTPYRDVMTDEVRGFLSGILAKYA